MENTKLGFLQKYFSPKTETEFFLTAEEKQEYLAVQREDLRREMEQNMASMVNLSSLFQEPTNDSFIQKWLPSILSGVTLLAVFLHK